MKLIIEVTDGWPYGEPWVFENAKEIYPDLDYDNLPNGWKKFFRDEFPSAEPFKVYSHSEKIRENDYIREIHHLRNLTEQEKQEKLEQARSRPKPFSSWHFDEELCRYVAPIPEPQEQFLALQKVHPHARVFWDEKNQNWEFRY